MSDQIEKPDRWLHFWIAIDQTLNALIGSGWADECLSSYYYRMQDRRMVIVDAIFFWQENHCKASYDNEMARKQLPIEMRRGKVCQTLQ